LAAAAGAAPSSSLHGSYKTKIRGKLAALNGNWRLEFRSRSTLHTLRNGHLVIVGKAVPVGARRLKISDLSGPYACSRSEGNGVYTYTLSHKRLTFTAVADKCVGRKLVLTTRPFVK
jgi:hypothetical protein